MRATIDGNEAAASVAYRLNEVCCIYPITPSSPMAELADEWASREQAQRLGHRALGGGDAERGRGRRRAARRAAERGAGDDVHGVAGPAADDPQHVQDRRRADPGRDARRRPVARGAGAVDLRRPLRRHGGPPDRLRAARRRPRCRRRTTWRSSPRPRRSRTRVPFVHFFDGFRTSHELNTIEMLSDDDLRALVPEELVHAHRGRGAVAGAPVHPRHRAEPRRLLPGARDGEPVLRPRARRRRGRDGAARRAHRPAIRTSSSTPAIRRPSGSRRDGLGRARPPGETVAALNARGERVGVVQVRLYRPFPAQALLAALPATVRRIAVLDRTKEPGSIGEPLFLDVVAALSEAHADGERAVMPQGDRRPLRPVVEGVHAGHGRRRVRGAGPRAAPAAVHHRHQRRRLRARACAYDPALDIESPETVRAVFFGLGADGTVGANKNTIKILGSEERPARPGLLRLRLEEVGLADRVAPALRAAADPRALPRRAGELRRLPPVRPARPGRRARRARRPARRCCSTAGTPPDAVWDALSRPVQEQILAKHLDVYAIDAGRIAREAGLAGRINIVLQTCFFAISGVLPREQAIDRIKESITKTYGKRGAEVVARNHAAVDRDARGAAPVEVPEPGDGHPRAAADGARARARVRPHRHRGDDGRPRRRPAGQRAAGGRHLSERHDGVREAQHLRARRGVGPRPVHPVRQLQLRLPAQRDPLALLRRGRSWTARRSCSLGAADAVGLPDTRYTLQVYVEDCTGCGLCVEACPVVGAGRPGPQGDQPRRPRAAGRRRARQHRVLRDAAGQPTGRASTSARCAARSSSSRCSSSPARARAAARRRTSSCCRSCSATGS